jgi:NADH dehydrogenase/NADH:ubiquinone reductase (non-electrogenic)
MQPAMPKKELLGSILVLGEAAAFPESNQQISNNSLLPQTAQVTGQEGAYAARILSRGYDLTLDCPVLPSSTKDFLDNVLTIPTWRSRHGTLVGSLRISDGPTICLF